MRAKSRVVIVLVLGLILFGGYSASASPVYMTFRATLDSVLDPDGVLAVTGEIHNGLVFDFTFMMDKDLPSQYTYVNGTTGSYANQFYGDLVSPYLLGPVTYPLWTNPTSSFYFEFANKSFNRGIDDASHFLNLLQSGSDDGWASISPDFLSLPIVGQIYAVNYLEQAFYKENPNLYIEIKATNAELLYLGSSPPTGDDKVPEPATFLLLGPALGTLGLWRAKARGEKGNRA